jgi:hypothetical protein
MINLLHNVAVKHNPTEADIRDYFWSLVDKDGRSPDPATGVKLKCWLWLGSVTDQGYGRFKAGGRTYMARRFAWQEMGKPDPGALTVSTRCSNKLCVRHLSTRTRAEIISFFKCFLPLARAQKTNHRLTKQLSTCLLAESVQPSSRAGSGNSKWHAEDWGSALWMHVHLHASVDLLPSRPGARFPTDPSAQRRPHHTSREGEASPPCGSLLSYSASCCPDCPKPSWSRRSSLDPPINLHSENRRQF